MIRLLINALKRGVTPTPWSEVIFYMKDGTTREFTMVKSVQRDFWTRVETTTSISMLRTEDVEAYDLID